MAGSCEQRGEA